MSNPTDELIECLDILMSVVDYTQEQREHTARITAFYDHYDNLTPGDDGGVDLGVWADIEDEYTAQFDTLLELSPVPAYNADELETAFWQTTSLAMTLLMDHMALLDVVQELDDARKVSEIIRPQLYVPGQAQ